MSWTSTARRNGVAGAANLFSREEWRQSEHGAALEGILRSALEDGDRVARFFAAHVIRHLEPDPQRALALIERRLRIEAESQVAAALTNELAVVARQLPAEVDALVGNFAESSLWQNQLTSASGRDEVDSFISLVLWLAIAHEAAAATAIAAGWFHRPAGGQVTERAVGLLRPWLSLPRSRSEERRRAFAFVRTAATTLDSMRLRTEPSDAAELYQTADTLVDQIYFASGAFGPEGSDRQPVPAEDGFADEAFSTFELLTGFKHPTITHRVVETLGHLSPADPRRALLLVERSISAGDAYTYDMLAAGVTIALVERYLAEYRDVVATDPDVLTAVRRVLDAFVRVGWPAAISLSYRLGDAFR